MPGLPDRKAAPDLLRQLLSSRPAPTRARLGPGIGPDCAVIAPGIAAGGEVGPHHVCQRRDQYTPSTSTPMTSPRRGPARCGSWQRSLLPEGGAIGRLRSDFPADPHGVRRDQCDARRWAHRDHFRVGAPGSWRGRCWARSSAAARSRLAAHPVTACCSRKRIPSRVRASRPGVCRAALSRSPRRRSAELRRSPLPGISVVRERSAPLSAAGTRDARSNGGRIAGAYGSCRGGRGRARDRCRDPHPAGVVGRSAKRLASTSSDHRSGALLLRSSASGQPQSLRPSCRRHRNLKSG
jgi:hypothetical protein